MPIFSFSVVNFVLYLSVEVKQPIEQDVVKLEKGGSALG